MMKTKTQMILTAAMAGMVALTAPLAASAAQPQQNRPQAQQPAQAPQTSHNQHSQQGPQAYKPQTQPSQSHNSQQQRPQQNSQQQAHRAGTYRITTTVNIRERANTQSRRVGQARAGRTVQVDRVSGNWLHIRNQGWISAQYARRA